MSFASEVRGELARLPQPEPCCARSELAAALLCSGGIAWRGHGRYAVTLTAGEAPTVRRYFASLKQFYGVTGQIRTLSGDALNNQTRYQLVVPEEDALRLLGELQMLDESAPFGLLWPPGVCLPLSLALQLLYAASAAAAVAARALRGRPRKGSS